MFKTYFTGNVVFDPKMATTTGGKSVCNIVVAVNKKYRRRGENGVENNDAIFVHVSIWGQQGEMCGRYLAKGRRIGVSGTITDVSGYVGKNGTPMSNIEVGADDVEFLQAGAATNVGTDKVEQAGAPQKTLQAQVDTQSGFVAVDEEELPF